MRIVGALVAYVLFLLWAGYKIFIDKKTTEKDIKDIKLGIIFITISAVIIYFLFFY